MPASLGSSRIQTALELASLGGDTTGQYKPRSPTLSLSSLELRNWLPLVVERLEMAPQQYFESYSLWPINNMGSATATSRSASATAWKCHICFSVPTFAVRTSCGHIFCWLCITPLVFQKKGKRTPCPVCSRRVTSARTIVAFSSGATSAYSSSSNGAAEPADRPAISPRATHPRHTMPPVASARGSYADTPCDAGILLQQFQQGMDHWRAQITQQQHGGQRPQAQDMPASFSGAGNPPIPTMLMPGVASVDGSNLDTAGDARVLRESFRLSNHQRDLERAQAASLEEFPEPKRAQVARLHKLFDRESAQDAHAIHIPQGPINSSMYVPGNTRTKSSYFETGGDAEVLLQHSGQEFDGQRNLVRTQDLHHDQQLVNRQRTQVVTATPPGFGTKAASTDGSYVDIARNVDAAVLRQHFPQGIDHPRARNVHQELLQEECRLIRDQRANFKLKQMVESLLEENHINRKT